MHHKGPDCNCSENGSINQECDNKGQCNCKNNVDGMKCDVCHLNTFGFPTCEGNGIRISYVLRIRNPFLIVGMSSSDCKKPANQETFSELFQSANVIQMVQFLWGVIQMVIAFVRMDLLEVNVNQNVL